MTLGKPDEPTNLSQRYTRLQLSWDRHAHSSGKQSKITTDPLCAALDGSESGRSAFLEERHAFRIFLACPFPNPRSHTGSQVLRKMGNMTQRPRCAGAGPVGALSRPGEDETWHWIKPRRKRAEAQWPERLVTSATKVAICLPAATGECKKAPAQGPGLQRETFYVEMSLSETV
jgi:hypothetical protein